MKEWVESSSLSSPNPVLRIPPEAHFVVEMEVATARTQGTYAPEGMCVCVWKGEIPFLSTSVLMLPP